MQQQAVSAPSFLCQALFFGLQHLKNARRPPQAAIALSTTVFFQPFFPPIRYHRLISLLVGG
jgi:hypothetical protein